MPAAGLVPLGRQPGDPVAEHAHRDVVIRIFPPVLQLLGGREDVDVRDAQRVGEQRVLALEEAGSQLAAALAALALADDYKGGARFNSICFIPALA